MEYYKKFYHEAILPIHTSMSSSSTINEKMVNDNAAPISNTSDDNDDEPFNANIVLLDEKLL
jgi:hypothetical protein